MELTAGNCNRLQKHLFNVTDKEHIYLACKIVEDDIKDINKSDIVLVNASVKSVQMWGTPIEVYHAHTGGKHVTAFIGDNTVSPWLINFSNYITENLEDAVELIKSSSSNRYQR